jgi:hypothetical protein
MSQHEYLQGHQPAAAAAAHSPEPVHLPASEREREEQNPGDAAADVREVVTELERNTDR